MIASPFTQAGPGLFENGYSPIPIMPNSKLPGTYADDSWKTAKGWNDYCTTRPSQLQINYWSKWPNAGVGVACGLGLICIDIDFEPAMDALLAMLPQSNVQKKGRKCQSAFDWDPLSASKRDPFDRRALLVALGSSELVGVAETARARVV
ncbi:hypothetical protein ABIF65_000021 [Bradyrhizobium japonicum]